MEAKTKLNHKKLLLIQSLSVFHVIEEYFFGFSDWATRYFGTTTQNWYILSHIILFIIIGIIAFYVYKGFKVGVFWALVLQVILFTNGLFHIFTTFFWRQYAPGVITQIIVIPVTYFVFRMIRQSDALSKKEILYSTITGCVISALIILSLYIDIPI